MKNVKQCDTYAFTCESYAKLEDGKCAIKCESATDGEALTLVGDKCQCADGYSSEGTTGKDTKCTKCKTGQKSNSDRTACECKDSDHKEWADGGCIKCDGNKEYDSGTKKCKCKQDWIGSDCSTACTWANASTTITVGMDHSSCNCKDTHAKADCSFACSSGTNTKGTSSGGKCTCNDNFWHFADDYNCVDDCSSGTQTKKNTANTACECNDDYVFSTRTTCIKCSSSKGKIFCSCKKNWFGDDCSSKTANAFFISLFSLLLGFFL